jgi:hypothetical protein
VVPLGVDDRHEPSVRTPSAESPFRGRRQRAPVERVRIMRLVYAYLERRRLLRMMQLLAASSRR